MNLPSSRRFRKGMVLFEVIMALSVFALVATSLVVALDVSMDASWRREKVEGALRGMENQMAQMRNSHLIRNENDLPEDDSGYSYAILSELIQLKDQKGIPLNGIYRVTVTATWKDGSENESREISELIYQP